MRCVILVHLAYRKGNGQNALLLGMGTVAERKKGSLSNSVDEEF